MDAGEAAPGDLMVYSLGRLGGRDRLRIGVLLRRRDDCAEIIGGNVADRV